MFKLDRTESSFLSCVELANYPSDSLTCRKESTKVRFVEQFFFLVLGCASSAVSRQKHIDSLCCSSSSREPGVTTRVSMGQ